jgi:NAD(P)-dependent dehydrogenase (short-subunit alcohol dehydrogenase family)
VQSFVNNVLEAFGGIDVLVNNAGILGPRVSLAEYPISEWERVVQANINGLFYMTRAVVPIMMIQKSGAIINVSSSVGRTGRQKWGAYAISKFATEGFTQVLAEELRSHNITVNSVNPGSMRTDMRREAYPNENPDLLRDPSEVAEVFIYLASDDGAGITGQAFDAANYYAPPKGM